jgi:predicted RecA/RadA family phage recombinase
MKNRIQEGDVLALTTPSGGVTSGQAILVGVILAIAVADYAQTVVGQYYVRGVFSVPKLSTDVVAEGVILYWDDTNKRLTVTASGNTKVGYATAAAGNGATTANILLGA